MTSSDGKNKWVCHSKEKFLQKKIATERLRSEASDTYPIYVNTMAALPKMNTDPTQKYSPLPKPPPYMD